MAMTRLIALCFCFSLSHVKAARTQTKALEEALAVSVAEAEGVKTEGKCKRWCTTQATSFPLDLELLKRQADAKCSTPRGQRECDGCAGGGVTIPDCQPKEIPEEELTIEAVSLSKTFNDGAAPAGGDESPDGGAPASGPDGDEVDAGDGIQQCREGGVDMDIRYPCRFKEGEWCSYLPGYDVCPPPTRGAGAKFNQGKLPLCCSKEDEDLEESEVSDAAEAKATALASMDVQKEEETNATEPAAAVPLCAEGHEFKVSTFERRGKEVSMCRDSVTGQFANKVCCDSQFAQLLEEKQLAEEICATEVEEKYCKPHINAFQNKRNKYARMPDSFACKRMYMCTTGQQGSEMVGPVPNQAWCLKEKTGLSKNLPATTTCVAVKL